MSKFNKDKVSPLLNNLEKIIDKVNFQEHKLEVIISKVNFQEHKLEVINNKLEKQDKTKWINTIRELFTLSFLFRSFSFFVSKTAIVKQHDNVVSWLNKKDVFKISNEFSIWIIMIIINEVWNSNKLKK
ncbi:MAG: hypothetical protein AD073_000327 [Mycoplasmataceae bacterium]|nr:MAG: hypothetical protein AD073_000327 [Mycoplasmataceae bacterium]